ncbi:hypothetical protein DFS34DRAFT_416885 [Phlyctochytrium arcticum]|nr:hypothetical protein DFS34DRAFT_416885 [Phlyctochytrium arcticum]
MDLPLDLLRTQMDGIFAHPSELALLAEGSTPRHGLFWKGPRRGRWTHSTRKEGRITMLLGGQSDSDPHPYIPPEEICLDEDRTTNVFSWVGIFDDSVIEVWFTTLTKAQNQHGEVEVFGMHDLICSYPIANHSFGMVIGAILRDIKNYYFANQQCTSDFVSECIRCLYWDLVDCTEELRGKAKSNAVETIIKKITGVRICI